MMRRLLPTLLERGLLDRATAEHARGLGVRTGLSPARILVEQGFIEDEVLADLAAEGLGLPRLSPAPLLDPDLAAHLGEDWSRRHGALPLHRCSDGRIAVAVIDPEDALTEAELRFRLEADLAFVVASCGQLDQLLRTVFHGPPAPSDEERLARAIQENKQAAEVLRVLFSLCEERGLLSRADLDVRLRERL